MLLPTLLAALITGASVIPGADVDSAVDDRLLATACEDQQPRRTGHRGNLEGPREDHAMGGQAAVLGDDRGDLVHLELGEDCRQQLVDDQHAKGIQLEETSMRRAISTVPVVKPIKITGPNSVFALGSAPSLTE
jgi:hypothetical protein